VASFEVPSRSRLFSFDNSCPPLSVFPTHHGPAPLGGDHYMFKPVFNKLVASIASHAKHPRGDRCHSLEPFFFLISFGGHSFVFPMMTLGGGTDYPFCPEVPKLYDKTPIPKLILPITICRCSRFKGFPSPPPSQRVSARRFKWRLLGYFQSSMICSLPNFLLCREETLD